MYGRGYGRGRKGHGFEERPRKGRGWGYGSGRGFGRGRGRGGWNVSGEVVETPRLVAGEMGPDEDLLPPPWAGFWRNEEASPAGKSRREWLLAWRDRLKERLAQVEAELRRMGEE